MPEQATPLSCPLESLRSPVEIMLPLNVRSYGRDCCRFGAATNVEDADQVATVGENGKLLVLSLDEVQRDDELKNWVGVRAQAGRIVPMSFPRSNSFGPAF